MALPKSVLEIAARENAAKGKKTQLRDERYWWEVPVVSATAITNLPTFSSQRRGNTGFWPFDRAAFQNHRAVVWGIGCDIPIETVSAAPAHPGVVQQVLHEARLTWRKEEVRIFENVPCAQFLSGLGVMAQDSTGGLAAPFVGAQWATNGIPAMPNRETLYVPEEFDDDEQFELLVNLNATTLVVTNTVALRIHLWAATIR